MTSNRVVGSRYLLGTGALLGAAVATKWTGLFILGPVIVVGALSLAAPAPPEDGPIRRRALNAAMSLLVAPMAVYVASYLMFFVEHGPAVGDFVNLQAAMFHHQWIHSHVQVQASAPVSWPLLAHPIRYISDSAATRELVLVGNPLLWWGFLAALPPLVYRVARHRRWQEVVVLGGYLLLYGPWLVIPRTRYLFYMLPAVPFMALGLVAVLRSLPAPSARRVGLAMGAAAVLAGAAYAPVWLYLSVRSPGCDSCPSSHRSERKPADGASASRQVRRFRTVDFSGGRAEGGMMEHERPRVVLRGPGDGDAMVLTMGPHRAHITRKAARTETGGHWAVGEAWQDPGFDNPPHTHDEAEAFYVLEGSYTFYTDADAVEDVGPGTFVLIPPGAVHGFRTGPQGGRLICFWPSTVEAAFFNDRTNGDPR